MPTLSRQPLARSPPSNPLTFLLQNGHSLLFKACDKGHVDVAKVLLEAGADTDIKANVSRYKLTIRRTTYTK
jgi:ankyrin repeat protein